MVKKVAVLAMGKSFRKRSPTNDQAFLPLRAGRPKEGFLAPSRSGGGFLTRFTLVVKLRMKQAGIVFAAIKSCPRIACPGRSGRFLFLAPFSRLVVSCVSYMKIHSEIFGSQEGLP